MGEQNAKNPGVDTTPIHAERHKNRDPNRNPQSKVQLPADDNRDNAMADSPRTTVLMRLSQFHEEKLHDAAADFDMRMDGDYVNEVWWSFCDAFGLMPHGKNGEKKPWDNPPEKKISDAWEKVDTEHHLVPNHFLHISDAHYEATDPSRDKIDGSFIHELDRGRIKEKYPNWAEMQFLVEFKRSGTDKDPFDDFCRDGPDATAKTRKKVRGQIMAYAERLFSYQHRSAAFLLLVIGNVFRVMCWDRSGVTVTEAVNYLETVKGTRALLEVLYAFARLSRAKQGFDTTATRLFEGSCGWQRMDLLANSSPHDLDSAPRVLEGDIHDVFTKPGVEDTYGSISGDGDPNLHLDPTSSCWGHASPPPVIPVLSHVRQMWRESLVPGFPRYRLTVGERDYLVGKHIFMASGMVGRGTRGYIALEWHTQRFVFLKDSWRAFYKGVESEGEILSKLNAAGVSNVPTVVVYGDLYDEPDEFDKPAPGNVSQVAVDKDDQPELEKYEDTHNEVVDREQDGPDNRHETGDQNKNGKEDEQRKPRVQETENARYHPALGDMEVDSELPPYLEKAPSAQEEWVNDGRKCTTPAKTGKPGSDPLPIRELPTPDEGPPTMPRPHLFSNNSTTPAEVPRNPPSTPRGVKRKFSSLIAQNQGLGLRHMVHTRLVVREICLPFTAFTSSKQLVRIVYGCITAHALALDNCGYMHRDVSAGNLLIYPHVCRKANGKYQVYWRGLLADWELAKHSTKTGATQPQRTGTWHFMSAYLLDNLNMPTTIADELEAFLHVLIYGVVRRMRSDNITSVFDFLESYFAGYTVNPMSRIMSCPYSKRASIVQGCTLTMAGVPIIFSTPDGKLAEEHPINELIAELLEVFHSRYAILKWEDQRRRLKAKEKQAREGTPTPQNRLPTVSEESDELDPSRFRKKQAKGGSSSQNDQPKIKEPTPKMYTDRDSLEEHYRIAAIFHEYFTSTDKGWPADDVIPDRLNEIVKPSVPPLTPQAETIAASDASAAESQVAASEDVPMDQDDRKVEPSALVAAAPTTDVPPHPSNPPNAETEDEPVLPDPSPERPKKRRRKDPVVKEAGPSEPPVAEVPTRRVTRSRAAAAKAVATRANAAVNAVLVAPPATAAAPVAPPPVAPPAVQASTRVTRSKSGKLPPAPTRAVAATTGAPTTTRRTRTATSRRTPAARTTSGPQTRTRRRAGVAAQESPEEAQAEPQPQPTRPRRTTRSRRS